MLTIHDIQDLGKNLNSFLNRVLSAEGHLLKIRSAKTATLAKQLEEKSLIIATEAGWLLNESIFTPETRNQVRWEAGEYK